MRHKLAHLLYIDGVTGSRPHRTINIVRMGAPGEPRITTEGHPGHVQVHARLVAVIELEHAESIEIGRSPDDVYLLVSDIARTGEWSPICRACRWDDGDGPTTGSWFTGHNEADGRTWQTRSQVVVAERGREFAWLVGGAYVRWGFTIEPSTGGSKLTESWQFRPEGIAMFQQKYGAQAQAHIDERASQAHAGIPVTLAAIKKIAESEG